MQTAHESIDKILPYGELIRGFANQSYISKGDLKKALRERGIVFQYSEKEFMVPCLSSLLLSPREFDNLRDCQNTREDNFKKSSSRIEWNSGKSLIDSLSDIDLQNVIPVDGINYELTKTPRFTLIENNSNHIRLDFEIERNDMNKSWYESKNHFVGNIVIEKVAENEIQIIKSHTSSETEELANKFQKTIITESKNNGYIQKEKKLNRILFGDFTNEDRIVFFYRLSSNVDSLYFKFIDITDMEFRPDDKIELHENIKWMHKKSELILKGNNIHDTFFIKEKEYHKYLQFWEMESSFKFNYINNSGTCNVVFSFSNFLKKGDLSEFEINISNFSLDGGATNSVQYKNQIKNKLLDIFENKKNETYHKFQEYLKTKYPST
jgi:hypothetical protein